MPGTGSTLPVWVRKITGILTPGIAAAVQLAFRAVCN